MVIRDCGPRDGLQGESPLDVDVRLRLATDLASAGLRDVEAAAFVSPRAVPSMAGAAEIVAQLPDDGTNWWVLVPNRRGAEMAVAVGASRITVTVSASPVYSEKNVHMTVDESLAQVAEIRAAAPDAIIDAVVSCSFGSSFGDRVTVADVARVCASLRQLGSDQLTLADTTGTATPRRIESVLTETGTDVGLHLHDTRATALTNADRRVPPAACAASTPESAVSAGHHSRRAQAATWRPRTSCCCSRTSGCTPASTSPR